MVQSSHDKSPNFKRHKWAPISDEEGDFWGGGLSKKTGSHLMKNNLKCVIAILPRLLGHHNKGLPFLLTS